MSNYVAEPFDLNEIYFNLFGYVAPPFPVLLAKNGVDGYKINPKELFSKSDAQGRPMIFPLKLKAGELTLDFAIEPIISISGANKIVRRYPQKAKKGGSIKERWSSNDYKIKIKGIFLDTKNDEYPAQEVRKLRQICEYQGAVEVVENPLFEIFNISRIVIKDFNIPFTVGEHAQSYELSCWSDEMFDALLEEI